MNDYSLAEIFDEVYKREFAEFNAPRRVFFSLRHRREMRKILYPNVARKTGRYVVSLSRRILIITVLLFLAVITGAVIIFRIEGFHGKVYHDNTQLFAVNTENCPQTIEYLYYLPEIPEGYVYQDRISNSTYFDISYINSSNKTMILHQFVKKVYNPHYDNEYHDFEELEINGKHAFFHGSENAGSIVWDNEDYILQISGSFTKEELINLAQSVCKEQ